MTGYFRSGRGQRVTNRWASQAHGTEVQPIEAGGLAVRLGGSNRTTSRVWGTGKRTGKVPTVFLVMALAWLTATQSPSSLQAAPVY